MTTIYCSHKLQKYLGFKVNQIDRESLNDLNSWNAHLINVKRKKCLFFINHETFFSFVVYDVKKADTKNLNQLFLNGLMFELNKLNLITSEQEKELKTRFTQVFLHGSINNRNIIGTMNSQLAILDFYKSEYEDMQDYFNTRTLNKIPIKMIGYDSPKESISFKIHSLFTTK